MNLLVKNDIQRLVNGYINSPRDIDANFELGWAFESIKQHASALTHYTKITELATDKLQQYEALIRIAENFRKQGGRPTSERAMLLHATSLLPERPEAYILLAKHYVSVGMYHEADSYVSIYKTKLPFEGPSLRIPIKIEPWELDLIGCQTEWNIGRGAKAREHGERLLNTYELPKEIIVKVREHISMINGDIYPVRTYEKSQHKFAVSFDGLDTIERNYAQALQDMFVLAATNGKKNGTYLEIGSNLPVYNNNTYLLESEFDWRGVSVELEASYNNEFNLIRKNPAITEDATTCNYDYLLSVYGTGTLVDYLQVDCEPAEITYTALQKIPFDKYTFRVITYEHDSYLDPTEKYKKLSREFLEKLGYKLVIGNVGVDMNSSFEDWYVHPDHVDMERLKAIKEVNKQIVPIHKHLLY